MLAIASVTAGARSAYPWLLGGFAVVYVTVLGPWLVSAKDTPMFLSGLALGVALGFAVYNQIKKAISR